MWIDIGEYQRDAQRTTATHAKEDKIINGCFGLAGECGEICDLMKKHMFQGHPMERERMIEELGDVLWYCAELAAGLEVDLADVAQQNIEKLFDRYPYGFEPWRSLERGKETAEEERPEPQAEERERERGLHGLRRGRTRGAGSPKDSLKQRP